MHERPIRAPRIPAATYRLQFNHELRFSDAKRLIPYLHALGITDVYASPYLKAQKGSVHGYDIVNPNVLNPEIGSQEEYDELMHELRKYEMGQILDIVPNHMSIGSENPWWMDILENGPSSVYAGFFDINWNPAEEKLKNKLLLPILGDQYGKVLERQELRVAFEQGAFFVYYYEHKLPLQPLSYVRVLQLRGDNLKSGVSPEDPHLTELLSIITALKHLPSHTETDLERINERYREKEIIKKRLFALYNDSAEIRDFIDENVKIFNGAKGDPKSFDPLDELLSEQAWRLSFWRVATEEINYRRFFDINDIAALRMENPAVFAETHRLVFQLIAEGKVTGLRVDHPDGLYDPPEYFRRLQRSCFVMIHLQSLKLQGAVTSGFLPPETESEMARQYEEMLLSDSQFRPFFIVGEKILTKGEKMPEDWQIFGTTGYVFLNSLNGIFVDTKNAKLFEGLYSKFTGAATNFQDLVYEKKKLVMQVAMSGEIHTLGYRLNVLAERSRHTRDFTLTSLTRAVMEVIAFFPVYRTYINCATVRDRDRQYIEVALSKARRKNPAINASIFDFLTDVLLLKFPQDFDEPRRNEWLDFVMRLQQITGPVMAKGLEDTAFYVYNRLASLNEVGGGPERFGTPLDAFHGQNIERSKYWPHALIATSTHDTKRSEDTRARINVLSEIPGKWRGYLSRWSLLNKKKKAVIEGQLVPDRNEEYLLYQTLLGVWPVAFSQGEGYEVFKARIKDYMLKALREAKVNTSWISPNTAYEGAAMSFIDAIIADRRDNKFLQEFMEFQRVVAHFGALNSLSQTLLKIASPGTPDFYQGTEIEDFSLVDPDNRRPVDFRARSTMLEQLKKRESVIGPLKLAAELSTKNAGERTKLYVTYKALNYRREHHPVFSEGTYIPVAAEGDLKEHVCAFVRQREGEAVVVIVPRLLTGLSRKIDRPPLGERIWGKTWVAVPEEVQGEDFHNIFTGETVETVQKGEKKVLPASKVFAHFPVAMLGRASNS